MFFKSAIQCRLEKQLDLILKEVIILQDYLKINYVLRKGGRVPLKRNISIESQTIKLL